MKIFCVAGAPGGDLALVADILTQAGVERHRPSRLDATLDLSRWHERLAASLDNAERPLQQPGRLWEQLAGSIFLENMGAPLWGWADARSTWLLEFWRDFEPGVQFVLVHTAPQRALAQAARAHPDHDPAAVLEAWQRYHQQLLRFHLRHPQRSLLVDAAQCEAAPRRLAEACASHWGMAFPHKPDAARAHTDIAPLAAYLAHQFCLTRPDVLALQHEAGASLHDLGADTAPRDVIGLREALRDGAQLHDRAGRVAGLQHELQDARGRFDQAHAAETAAQARLAEVQRKLDWTEQQRRELNKELEARRAAVIERDRLQAELRAAQSGLDGEQKENEILLRQLQQVQDELEHYFLAFRTADLERGEAEQRWRRLQARQPDYSDYEGIAAHTERLTHDGATIYWRIAGLSMAGRVLAELRFHTVIARDTLQFVFTRADCDAHAGLLRWPAPGSDHVVVDAQEGVPANLAGADLRLLQVLCRLLGDAVAHDLVPLEGVAGPGLAWLLRRQGDLLRALPATLRYDQMRLKRAQVNADYEHLWIELDNVELGAWRAPHGAFRLACADVRPQHFGACPKLEFPADGGPALLETWRAEAGDDFGAKLELRFALPDAMDIAVWQALSAHDQAVVTGLVDTLPHLLAALEHQDARIARAWSDWRALAQDIQRIHLDHGRPAGAQAAPAAIAATQ